jgi:hypothetical protein
MFRAIGTVPIQLNEPLAHFLLRPKIFMNPAREFRIGAWATLFMAIDPTTKRSVTKITWATTSPPKPAEDRLRANGKRPRCDPKASPRTTEQKSGTGGAGELS